MKVRGKENRERKLPADRGRRNDHLKNSPIATQHASLIYGALPVLEALRSAKRKVDKVIVADGAKEHRLNEIIDLCRERSIPWNRVPRDTFDRLLDANARHQGVAAYVAPVGYADAEDLIDAAGENSLFVLLDGVEDPRNLGAILRVAECSGVDGVIIPERRAVGLNDTVAKSSAGAVEHVSVAKTPNLNRLIEKLKEKNIWVVGAAGETNMSYSDWDWTRPSALVLGSEGDGLHRLVAENCDVLVKIPMYGKIDSLNVSVAAGVILFEARRQRASSELPESSSNSTRNAEPETRD